MPMIAGIMKRAMNSGYITGLQGHIVYENDHFVWHQGTEERLEHVPLFPGDRGEPIGAYAVARIKGQDRPMFRVMDKARIEKARAVSKQKDGAVWRTWWDEMAIKTVVRNLAKSLPADAEIERVTARDDEPVSLDDSSTTIDAVLGQEAPPAVLSRLDVLEGTIENDPLLGGAA
jgi:recombination protein RecT